MSRDEVDETGRRVRLATTAREERGRGAATATIESSLSSVDGRTRVTTVTDLTLSGTAAQYGRGLVQGVTEQLLRSFAECLEAQLAAELVEEPEPAQPRAVSGLALGLGALRSSLERRKGLTAALWTAFFFVYLWLGMMAVGVGWIEAAILSALLGATIFVFIRLGSDESPGRLRSRGR